MNYGRHLWDIQALSMTASRIRVSTFSTQSSHATLANMQNHLAIHKLRPYIRYNNILYKDLSLSAFLAILSNDDRRTPRNSVRRGCHHNYNDPIPHHLLYTPLQMRRIAFIDYQHLHPADSKHDQYGLWGMQRSYRPVHSCYSDWSVKAAESSNQAQDWCHGDISYWFRV